jgi:Glycosyl transferases group 1
MKITILSTFPFDTPRHGGQHRLHNIAVHMRAQGHDVTATGINDTQGEPGNDNYLAQPEPHIYQDYIEHPWLMEDWAAGQLFAKNDHYFQQLAARIPADADLLYCELPWLVAFAVRLRKAYPQRRFQIVYGSENVECLLKKAIIGMYRTEEFTQHCYDLIYETEVAALKAADWCVAVTKEDILWAHQHTNKPIILAPNGVNARQFATNDLDFANYFSGKKQYALLCASAHPPNMSGFFKIFAPSLAFLNPMQRLVTAGSIGDALVNDERFKDLTHNNRFINVGMVEESLLAALLKLAHTIVLPITEGEGTNLKSAEALWEGKHIVATQKAMRGFENFTKARGVRIANTPEDFCAAVRESLSQPPLVLDEAERRERESLLWRETLRPLIYHLNASILGNGY